MDHLKKAAAVDLWIQMLDRARNNDWSAFDDPDYTPSDAERAARLDAYKAAGWKVDEIEIIESRTHERALAAPITSPGVSRYSEVMLSRVVDALLCGLSPAQHALAQNAHFVVEPKSGPLISKINVVMTDQSIIAMGTHFTRFCGLVARAYVRTCNLLPFETGIGYNEKELRQQLRRRPDLVGYWWRIFTSYALTGTHILTDFRPSTREEVFLMEQMAIAMEIFGLAHELGHHCLDHGRSLEGQLSPKEEEFEADLFAVKLCEKVEATVAYKAIQGFELQNPYLSTGAGGVLLLGAIELFRKVKEKIFHNPRFDTHPDFLDRANKLMHRHVLDLGLHQSTVDFCSSATNVLRCVMLELEPIMEVWPFHEFASRMPDDWEIAQERPY